MNDYILADAQRRTRRRRDSRPPDQWADYIAKLRRAGNLRAAALLRGRLRIQVGLSADGYTTPLRLHANPGKTRVTQEPCGWEILVFETVETWKLGVAERLRSVKLGEYAAGAFGAPVS